ncbi:MAG: hypothetical protein JSS76_12605 [Bacteroidetes bacterium]|nr:hypothetical protein [Bacteroidota bacterium]MBS1685593.1 hypothetical protein [Bacteroidota bacterium]
MYKEHLYINMERELLLLKQHATLIQDGELEYRTTDKTRSTLELMRYLSGVGATMLRWYIDNDLTKEEWDKINSYRASLTLENFPARIDEQMLQIRSYMDRITEDDLLHKMVEMPNKEKLPLGAAIMMGPVKWLTTYRMQLFNHLKANGRPDLGTAEAWRLQAAPPVV